MVAMDESKLDQPRTGDQASVKQAAESPIRSKDPLSWALVLLLI